MARILSIFISRRQNVRCARDGRTVRGGRPVLDEVGRRFGMLLEAMSDETMVMDTPTAHTRRLASQHDSCIIVKRRSEGGGADTWHRVTASG